MDKPQYFINIEKRAKIPHKIITIPGGWNEVAKSPNGLKDFLPENEDWWNYNALREGIRLDTVKLLAGEDIEQIIKDKQQLCRIIESELGL